ncbi:MAG: hypothetical protein MJD61_22275 [Proteobacteria bacterium]|nr:hypothetical protein [Pseudomonadota bacterium]
MAIKRKYSTATVMEDGRLVPWLAARGELGYHPEAPPERDYFFQYGWVLPDIFARDVARRRHLYFGAHHRDDAREVFLFWQAARAGAVSRMAFALGAATSEAVKAPIAVYRHESRPGRPTVVFIQHGSYQIVEEEDQPLLASGHVLLYRGVQKAHVFSMPDTGYELESGLWSRYVTTQAAVLSDSALSFNSVHDRTVRCETGHLRDRSRVSDEIARQHKLPIDSEASAFWESSLQSFSLARWVAANKFGPNHVIGKTRIDNIRITTFFAGEHEVRVLDPRRVELVEAIGCEVRALTS